MFIITVHLADCAALVDSDRDCLPRWLQSKCAHTLGFEAHFRSQQSLQSIDNRFCIRTWKMKKKFLIKWKSFCMSITKSWDDVICQTIWIRVWRQFPNITNQSVLVGILTVNLVQIVASKMMLMTIAWAYGLPTVCVHRRSPQCWAINCRFLWAPPFWQFITDIHQNRVHIQLEDHPPWGRTRGVRFL